MKNLNKQESFGSDILMLEKAVTCIKNKRWLDLKELISKAPGMLNLNLGENLPHLGLFEIEPTLLYFIQRYADETDVCKQVFLDLMRHSDWEQTEPYFGNTPFTFAVSTGNISAINTMFDFIKDNKPELLTHENKIHDDAKNTPLLLAIKKADKETALKLIPYYQKDELLSMSRQYNSALQLACYLKMNDIIVAILNQAEKLGCKDLVLKQVNGKYFTANELYKAPFQLPKPYIKDGVVRIGKEIHYHITGFNEEITKHHIANEKVTNKNINKEIEDLLSSPSELIHQKPISVDALIRIYETPPTSDENKAWIAISDSKIGTISSNIKGGSGGDFGNGWKVHISVDPIVIEEAAVLIAQVLNKPDMPRVSIKFAGKKLAQAGQPGKQVALCFYEKELENPEKIASLLNLIELLFYMNNIGRDNRAINSDKNYIPTKWDASIQDTSNKPSRFNYRNEDCTIMSDELFNEAALELNNAVKKGVLPINTYCVIKDNYILQDRGAQIKQSYYLQQRNIRKGHCPVDLSDLTTEERKHENAKYFIDPFAKIQIKTFNTNITTQNVTNLDWNALNLEQQSNISLITKKIRSIPTSDFWAKLTLNERQAILQSQPDHEKKSFSSHINNSMFTNNNQIVNDEQISKLTLVINTKISEYYNSIEKKAAAYLFKDGAGIAILNAKINVLLAAIDVLASGGLSPERLKEQEKLPSNAGWNNGKETLSLVNQVKTLMNIPLNWDDSESLTREMPRK